jgi:hypothetical protein
MKKLQVNTANGWQWVFCRKILSFRPITTTNKAKALPALAESYFKGNYTSHEFRVAEHLSDE